MYLEFTIFCPDDLKEIVQAELMNAGFEGVWDSSDGLKFYIHEEDLSMDSLKEILVRYNLIESYTYRDVEQVNWNETWERSFEPLKIGETCMIRAAFHPPSGLPMDIVITPKMSFGTGHHETTRLMIETMMEMDLKGKSVLDMGCGTGILAIYAEKAGAERILAVDYDDWAIENSLENIQNNNCTRIEVLKSDAGFSGNFDVILSNINRNINLEMLIPYSRALLEGGSLLLSGFYIHDIPDIEKRAGELGLKIVSQKKQNDWSCLLIQKG